MATTLVRTIDDCIKVCDGVAKDVEYHLSKARSPIKKRSHNSSLELWHSIKYHLTELKKLKESK